MASGHCTRVSSDCATERLKNKYISDSVISRFPGKEEMSLEHWFVDPTIRNVSKKVGTAEGDISYKDLLRGKEGEKPPTRVLLQAESGFGKTVLLSKIAYDWSVFEEETLQNFQLVFLLKLRYFQNDKSFEDFINAFYQQFKCQGDAENWNLTTTLILLDGYNELTKGKRKQVKDFLSTFIGTAILTSRPETDKTFLKLFRRQYNIDILDTENSIRLVENYFLGDTDGKIARENITVRLREGNTYVSEMPPLHLCAFCYYLRYDQSGEERDPPDIIFETSKMLMNLVVEEDQLIAFLCSLAEYFNKKLHSKEYCFTDMKTYFHEKFKLMKKCLILQKIEAGKYTAFNETFMSDLANHFVNDIFQGLNGRNERLQFLRQYFGEFASIKVKIILDEDKPALILHGEDEQTYYVLFHNQSIISGTFLKKDLFSNETSKVNTSIYRYRNLKGFKIQNQDLEHDVGEFGRVHISHRFRKQGFWKNLCINKPNLDDLKIIFYDDNLEENLKWSLRVKKEFLRVVLKIRIVRDEMA